MAVRPSSWLLVLLALPLLFGIVSCGGGSGNSSTFTLNSFSFGRGVITGGRFEILSPLTYGEIDPRTGYANGESLISIADGIEINREIRAELDSYQPLVIPRDAVLALDFQSLMDPSSIRPDVFENGELVEPGSISIRKPDGTPIPVAVSARGLRVFISPLVPTESGFPESPRLRDAQGNAVSYPGGWLSIVLPEDPALRPRTLAGFPISPRADRLGEFDNPLRFTPGHENLDFIEQNSLFPFGATFGGFLPTRTSPRIVRTHTFSSTLEFGAGDSADLFQVTDQDADFEPRAKEGLGEWASAVLRVRPGLEDEESTQVLSHDRRRLILDPPLTVAPRDGDTYVIERREWFEPDSNDPIDDDIFDPFNPQNRVNEQLEAFLQIQELDEDGQPIGEILDATESIPPRVQIALEFDQPISPDRINPHEVIRVSSRAPGESNPELLPGTTHIENLGFRVVWSPRVGEGDTSRLHGLSPFEGAYLFEIQTVPTLDFITQKFGADVAARVQRKGFRSLADRGGVPLAFPSSAFSEDDDRLVFEATLLSQGWEDGPYLRAVVHPFLGSPEKRVNPDGSLEGIFFQDERHFYGPTSQDIDLLSSGRLAGAPVQAIQRVFDSDHPTPDGSTDPGPFAFGATTPFSGYLFEGLGYQANFGSAMGMLYNHTWVSPAPEAGPSPYELTKLSWAAFNDIPGPDIFESLALEVGHSPKRPTPSTSFQQGLGQERLWFDNNDEDQENYCGDLFATGAPPAYEPPLHQGIPRGTRSIFRQKALFSPPTSQFTYLTLFDLESAFEYDNERGLYIEVLVEPQNTPPSFFTAFIGNQITPGFSSPLLRNWTIGSDTASFDPYAGLGDRRYQEEDGPTPNNCWQGPVPVAGASPFFGDNFIYYSVFDWIKRRSTIESSLDGRDGLSSEQSISWLPALTSPSTMNAPFGTDVTLELQGSLSRNPEQGAEWTENPSDLEGLPYARFRLRLSGNGDVLTIPSFDSVVLVYEIKDLP